MTRRSGSGLTPGIAAALVEMAKARSRAFSCDKVRYRELERNVSRRLSDRRKPTDAAGKGNSRSQNQKTPNQDCCEMRLSAMDMSC